MTAADVAASRSAEESKAREVKVLRPSLPPPFLRPSVRPNGDPRLQPPAGGQAGRLLVGGKEGEADVGVVKRKLVWSPTPMQCRALFT